MSQKPTYEELQKRTKALEQAEEELVQIFSMSLDMICIADINTATFIKVNPAFTEILGHSEEMLLDITDTTMPHMTGDLLAQQMINIRPDIPILLCTGYSDRVDRARAKEMGIKGFAMKPLDKGKLARVVRKVLDHNPAA